MSRAAVLSLLRADGQLAALGGTGFSIVSEYASDQIPSQKGPYIVICWRTTDFTKEIQDNGPRHFELWVHIPVSVSTDFGRIDAILDRCDEIFRSVEEGDPVAAGDGWQLEQIGFEGRGIDITDDGYETICRSASYYAMSSKVTT